MQVGVYWWVPLIVITNDEGQTREVLLIESKTRLKTIALLTASFSVGSIEIGEDERVLRVGYSHWLEQADE